MCALTDVTRLFICRVGFGCGCGMVQERARQEAEVREARLTVETGRQTLWGQERWMEVGSSPS